MVNDMDEHVDHIYVATNGDDTSSGGCAAPEGNRKGPLATLEGARNAIRRLKHEGRFVREVHVLLGDGTYRLTRTFKLSRADAGTENAPIVYRSAPGQRATISGGRSITGWRQYRESIWCADVPDVRRGLWSFRQLFCNGERMIRARTPKRDPNDPLYGGWAFVESLVDDGSGADRNDEVQEPRAFRFDPNHFPRRWSKPHQAEVFIIPGSCWISDWIPIQRVDFDAQTIYLTRPVGPSRHTLAESTHIRAGNRFYVENNLEDLTEPGEWCLDQETGTIYFRPPDDVEPRNAEIVAPCVEQLIEMIGSTSERGARVAHVALRDLRFSENQIGWPKPDAYYKTPNASAAVFLQQTEHCRIEQCVFDKVGGDAIRLHGANAHDTIADNEIVEAGAYGIFVANRQSGFCRHDPVAGDVPSPGEWVRHPEDRIAVVAAWPRTVGHRITNNHIHHVGVYEKHAQGIAFFGVSAADVVVSHNHIHHIPRFGIGLMSGFGRVTIEYNELHDLSLETCDTGGITANRWYVYDDDPQLRHGPIIRHNRVRDVIGCGAYGVRTEPGGDDRAGGRIWTRYYSWGIYFDNAPMDVGVYGNICARNTLGGIMICWHARDVVVENNIFVDSSTSQGYFIFAGRMNIILRRNIFGYREAGAHYLRLTCAEPKDLHEVFDEFDGNLISPPAGEAPTLDGEPGEALQRAGAAADSPGDCSFEWWRRQGFDLHSVIGDARFADPEHDRFDLKPDSPAWALGFEPIDTSLIGIERVTSHGQRVRGC